jgi:predicted Zn-dependent protease
MTEPITGRRQLNIMPQSEEMSLGLASFDQMKKEVAVSHDPAVNALVEKVGRRIAAVAELPNAQWEFVVFESKEANAFCLPGGKVGVYTGILPITSDEAGLATVIGHEVAHAVARHGGERMTEAMALQKVGDLVAAQVAKTDPKWQAVASTAYGLGTQVGVALPHSRTQETSADEIGLVYMARAGYQPSAAVSFWQRFAEYNRRAGDAGPAFLRTHPLDDQRIENLKKWLPRAQNEFRPQP